MARALSVRQAWLLGVIVLLGLTGAAFALFQIGDRQQLWHGTFQVSAGFDSLKGVGVGTRVRVRGMEAGSVSAIDLPSSKAGPLLVRMKLTKKFQNIIFADASAAVLSEGMVGGKVVEIDPGTPEAGPIADGATLAVKNSADLGDLLTQAVELLGNVKQGQGTVGKLMTDDGAYKELVATLNQARTLAATSQDAAAAIQQNADALKKMPIVRGYVEDHDQILIRPAFTRHRQVIASDELFVPGKSLFNETGKARLDALKPWFADLKIAGSDVVVVVYDDPARESSADVARVLTLKQAEAVADYLKSSLYVHKLGWVSRRTVRPIGRGLLPALPPEKEQVPPGRIEVIVFVPG